MNFWKEMAVSAEKFISSDISVTFHVFTDQKSETITFSKGNIKSPVMVHEIGSLGWPEATLLRYKLYDDNSDKFLSNVQMHLDADMLFVREFNFPFHPNEWESGILLVKHPGFFRKFNFFEEKSLFKSIMALLKNYVNSFRRLGNGTWENNRRSTSFVGPLERRVYVCGGIWMGRNENFLKMVRILRTNVETDLKNSIIAKWHDESHLNWFNSFTRVSVASPIFCFDGSYPLIGKLIPVVIAVDKNKLGWIRN